MRSQENHKKMLFQSDVDDSCLLFAILYSFRVAVIKSAASAAALDLQVSQQTTARHADSQAGQDSEAALAADLTMA